jgi:hypothetical protein
MKRALILLSALCLTLSLTACGGGGSAPQTDPVTVDSTTLPDPETMAQAYLDGGAFSESLEALDLDTAYRLYGLADYNVSREDLVGGAVYLSAGATAEEVAVLTCASANVAHAAQEALEAHLEAQKEAYADYLPDEVTKLEQANVVIYGDTVILTVAADQDAADAVVVSFVPD